MVETESAIKLVTELKINKLFPKYNEQLLTEITQEITKNFVSLAELLSDPNLDPEDDCNVGSLLIKQQVMNRNIRCAAAYL
jgi:hypothetical protein